MCEWETALPTYLISRSLNLEHRNLLSAELERFLQLSPHITDWQDLSRIFSQAYLGMLWIELVTFSIQSMGATTKLRLLQFGSILQKLGKRIEGVVFPFLPWPEQDGVKGSWFLFRCQTIRKYLVKSQIWCNTKPQRLVLGSLYFVTVIFKLMSVTCEHSTENTPITL